MDWLVQALTWFVDSMNSGSGGLGQAILQFAVLLLVWPVGVLVHELGHAFAARRYGAEADGLVAAGEGPAVTGRFRGMSVRFGLGLGREFPSKDPEGWVAVAFSRLTLDQAVSVLRAGPLAQAAYGLIVGVSALAAPLPTLFTIALSLSAAGVVGTAVANLGARGPAESDGARIAALRAWQVLKRCGLAAERPTEQCLEPPPG